MPAMGTQACEDAKRRKLVAVDALQQSAPQMSHRSPMCTSGSYTQT
jgi:hypothetical protein